MTKLNFTFYSSDHLRYENNQHVSGPHGGAPRVIKVEEDTNGCQGYNLEKGKGYIVTIYNVDGTTSIQVSPKPMKLITQSVEKIVLQGYKVEAMSPFGWTDIDLSDYGLSIILKNGEIEKCILHMYDRDSYIEYLK